MKFNILIICIKEYNLWLLKPINSVTIYQIIKPIGHHNMIRYIVKHNGGYYAKKQQDYFEWSFTNDLILANIYKTKKLAKEQLKRGTILDRHSPETHQKYKGLEIIKVNVENIITIV